MPPPYLSSTNHVYKILGDQLLMLVSARLMGFTDSSIGQESACNAGDPGLLPGSGRSAGEGTGYPLQYSWSSLVAQLVKNLPTMRTLGFLEYNMPWIV